MSKKIVIILTSSFPFGFGEQFLESEITYWNTVDAKVIICPVKVDGLRRDIPENIVTSTDLAFQNSRGNSIYKLKVLFSKYLYLELFNNVQIIFRWSLFKSLLITLSNTIEIYEKLDKYIAKTIKTDTKLIIYSYWFDITAYAAAITKRNTKNTIVLTRAHRSDLYKETRKHGYMALKSLLLRYIDIVYPISENGRNYLIEKYLVDPRKVIISRLGVPDLGIITKQTSDGFVSIVSCSFCVEVKRINLCIDGIAEFSKENSAIKIRWIHIGDGPLRYSLEQYAQKSFSKFKNIQWSFIGALENQDVYKYYKNNNIDVFINTSSSEGIPVSIMEAQSFGIPVIAPDVGGINEIVDTSNGVLLRSNFSNNELAEGITKILELKDEQKRENIKRVWKERYYSEKNFNRFISDVLNR